MLNKNFIVFFILAPLLSLVLTGSLVYYKIYSSGNGLPETMFEIKRGEAFPSVNARLCEQNLISSCRLFHYLNRYLGTLEKYKAGFFKIPNNATMVEVHKALVLSKNVVSLTTIPEGKNIFDIAQILSKKKIVDAQEFLQLAFDQNFLKTLNIEAQSVEGYLYPNSYDFQSVKDPKKIISMMVREFFERTKDLDPKVQNLSFQEMLILASMVEKETGHGGERKKVAGVFFNRLRDKMRLQSDPTTIYGILVESKGKFSGNITKNDLLTPSPYNTYTVSALPKGPISNPGIEAMEAVLDPENHKFYYFVSMNDGTHVFSENYEEHLEAVRKWQMNASNRKDRSWRDLKK